MNDVPEDASELREWLERLGLEDPELLVVIDNDDLDQLDRDQMRLLHGLLEARWQLEQPQPDTDL